MSDRHEKWVAIEPGFVIPAGQPHAVRYNGVVSGTTYAEFIKRRDYVVPQDIARDKWFIDSSWKPPLELPTEPTWGVVLVSRPNKRYFGLWSLEGARFIGKGPNSFVPILGFNSSDVIDFIKCTPEQVARMGVTGRE